MDMEIPLSTTRTPKSKKNRRQRSGGGEDGDNKMRLTSCFERQAVSGLKGQGKKDRKLRKHKKMGEGGDRADGTLGRLTSATGNRPECEGWRVKERKAVEIGCV